MKQETLLILDFGSQYTQLISRAVRKMKVYSVIYPYYTSLEEVSKEHDVKGIILSGGPRSVYDAFSIRLDKHYLEAGVPILGICYGMQLLAYLLGGKVEGASREEYGYEEVSMQGSSRLFEGIPFPLQVWMSHGDHVVEIPEGFRQLAVSSSNGCSAMECVEKGLYGVQFHPEVAHTQYGERILSNFLFSICHLKADWEMESFIERTLEEVRQTVGDKKVVLGLSGGVDSTTLAVLLEKAIGNCLTCIFVDNGLLRQGEVQEVCDYMKRYPQIHFVFVDAGEEFLAALKGVVEPEEKRRIIGRVFIEVFNREAKDFDFLAQGTLYPDVIESVNVKGPSDVIKTHHNRVSEVLCLIEENRVIEPFRNLFKDEVREIAQDLSIPASIIGRHPFPGPGLAIRILGEVTADRLSILRAADAIYTEELRKAGLYDGLWQSFVVLLPIRSVGVVGDKRTYGYTVVLRSVTSRDGMTADFAYPSKEFLTQVSSRIIGEVKEITRVALDISSKPPATIEWE